MKHLELQNAQAGVAPPAGAGFLPDMEAKYEKVETRSDDEELLDAYSQAVTGVA